jgi:hypothetical protein
MARRLVQTRPEINPGDTCFPEYGTTSSGQEYHLHVTLAVMGNVIIDEDPNWIESSSQFRVDFNFLWKWIWYIYFFRVTSIAFYCDVKPFICVSLHQQRLELSTNLFMTLPQVNWVMWIRFVCNAVRTKKSEGYWCQPSFLLHFHQRRGELCQPLRSSDRSAAKEWNQNPPWAVTLDSTSGKDKAKYDRLMGYSKNWITGFTGLDCDSFLSTTWIWPRLIHCLCLRATLRSAIQSSRKDGNQSIHMKMASPSKSPGFYRRFYVVGHIISKPFPISHFPSVYRNRRWRTVTCSNPAIQSNPVFLNPVFSNTPINVP